MNIQQLKKYQGKRVEIIREVAVDRENEAIEMMGDEVLDEEETEEETIRGFVDDVWEDYNKLIFVKHITMKADDIIGIRELNENEEDE